MFLLFREAVSRDVSFVVLNLTCDLLNCPVASVTLIQIQPYPYGAQLAHDSETFAIVSANLKKLGHSRKTEKVMYLK